MASARLHGTKSAAISVLLISVEVGATLSSQKIELLYMYIAYISEFGELLGFRN